MISISLSGLIPCVAVLASWCVCAVFTVKRHLRLRNPNLAQRNRKRSYSLAIVISVIKNGS